MLKISSSLKILLGLVSLSLATQVYSSQLTSLAVPSDLAKMSPEKLESMLTPVTYEGLSPRTLLRLSEDVKTQVNSRTEFIIISEGYEAKLEFSSYKDAQIAGELKQGDFLRVIYASVSESITISGVGKGKWEAEHEDEKNIEVTFIRVDKSFKPIGGMFSMKTKADPSEEVDVMQKVSGEILGSFPALRYDRALKDDILVNMLQQKVGGLTIPPGTRSLVKSVSWERISWTLNYHYTLKLQLIDCPEAFKKVKCETSISGDGGFPNHTWAHQVASQNARITNVLGVEVHY